MRFQKKVSNKEFAQEILVGSIALACLFAIFLFVAIQKWTGKSLSPLAYLWPTEEKDSDEGIPVVVFRTEEARRNAFEQYDSTKPKLDRLLAKFNASTERIKQERLAKEKNEGKPKQIDPKNLFTTLSRHTESPKKLAREMGLKSFANSKTDSPKSPNQIQLANHLDDSSASEDKVAPPNSSFDPISKTTDKPPSSFDPTSFGQAKPSIDSAPPPSLPTKELHTPKTENAFIPSQLTPARNVPVHSLSDDQPTENDPNKNQTTNAIHSFSDSRTLVDSPKSLRSQNRKKTQPFANSSNTNRIEQKKKAEANSLQVTPEPSDSFWSLSQTYYGDGKYFDRLAKFNDATNDSDNLPRVVLVPSLNELLDLDLKDSKKTEKANHQGEAGIHVTKQDETLFEIAREQLGSAARFVELIKLNQAILPADTDAQTELKNGLRLRLPNK